MNDNSVPMDHKRIKTMHNSSTVYESLPPTTAPQKINADGLNLLPNEILFCIFDYLSPIDIVRALDYDLNRFGPLITQHIVVYGLDLIKIKSTDLHFVPTCLSLVKEQYLSIYVNDRQLSTVLTSVPSPSTFTIILNTPFEQSLLSKIQQTSISCTKLLLEYTPSYHRQMTDIDIIPLLSPSVNTLIMRNVVFLLDQSATSYVCNSLQHIRCILKSENDLYELLKRLPMLLSLDIRLVAHATHDSSGVLPLPGHFRIEYPYGTIINPSKYPQETRCYDQTVYTFPWSKTNSSLILRSCNPKNYISSFPHPLPYIRRLTIECTPEEWSYEFVTFLRQTFPNTRTLYAIQDYNSEKYVMTIITANERKHGRCSIGKLYCDISIGQTSLPAAIRFLKTDRAYN